MLLISYKNFDKKIKVKIEILLKIDSMQQKIDNSYCYAKKIYSVMVKNA